MQLEQLMQKIKTFKRDGTSQTWRMDTDFFYENEYITVLRIDSSNVTGGTSIKKGKQWSIIIDLKRSFSSLLNWKTLKDCLGKDLKVTEVTHGKNAGNYGIRLYRMSTDPTNEIISDLLDFIFS